MSTLPIDLPDDQLMEFCKRWHIAELALFGSVLRDDFRPDSDIDMLISFASEATPGLLGLVQMKDELEELLGRNIDLVTKKAIENSENWIRRQNILQTAQVVYATR
jgi:predicted nucleotidyltransferase